MGKNTFMKRMASDMSVCSLRFFLATVTVIPRKVLNLIRQILFTIAYPFMGRIRRICDNNLRSVFGDSRTQEEYTAMIKGCIRYISQGMVDLLHFVQRPDGLLPITRVHNEEVLRQALSHGHGVIAVTAHLGNFPLMFVALVQKGYKVNVIIRPMRDQKFSEFMFDLCDRRQVHMIPTYPRTHFLRECLGALKRNELLFILLDEFVEEDSGITVEFFNRQVPRGLGPILFQSRTGSPVLPMFIIKNNEDGFEIFIEPPLDIKNGGAHAPEHDRVKIARLTKTIEEYVRRYPLQWGGWLNKRWSESLQ